VNEAWDADRVRALRDHLRESQSRLAGRIGTRQQTVSEWETVSSRPRRMSRRLLHLVAEEAGFYTVEQRSRDAGGAGSGGGANP
jgi:DNA-binding transcriptional regulator YiaG